jgi:hypothetical protein
MILLGKPLTATEIIAFPLLTESNVSLKFRSDYRKIKEIFMYDFLHSGVAEPDRPAVHQQNTFHIVTPETFLKHSHPYHSGGAGDKRSYLHFAGFLSFFFPEKLYPKLIPKK